MNRSLISKVYLSDCKPHEAEKMTGLSYQEIEEIVGRFRKHTIMEGKVRGAVYVYPDKVEIRHHFTRKLLWSNQ